MAIKKDLKKAVGDLGAGLREGTLGLRKVGKIPTGVSVKPVQRLTQEQSILGEMFGGGDGCVLGGKDGEGLPRMNHALNPGQLGEDGTAELFGFGGRPQRSGLF